MMIMIAFSRDGEGEVVNLVVNDRFMIPLGHASPAQGHLKILGVMYVLLH